MPHESTVDPEDPMHFKSWGDDENHTVETPLLRRTLEFSQATPASLFGRSTSIQTHPDLPLHVTHDHDNDGDADDEENGFQGLNQDFEFDLQAKVQYTPPKKQSK